MVRYASKFVEGALIEFYELNEKTVYLDLLVRLKVSLFIEFVEA